MLCPYSVLGVAHFYIVKNGFHTIIYKFEMLTKLEPLIMCILCNFTPIIFSSLAHSVEKASLKILFEVKFLWNVN